MSSGSVLSGYSDNDCPQAQRANRKLLQFETSPEEVLESSGVFKIKEVLESLILHLQTRIATNCYNSKTVNVHIKEFSAISQDQEEYESFLASIRIKRSV